MYHLRVIPVVPKRYLQKKLLARGWYSVGAARTIFGKQQTDDINIDWSHKNHYIKYYSTAPSTIKHVLVPGDPFAERHIGPNDSDKSAMLEYMNYRVRSDFSFLFCFR